VSEFAISQVIDCPDCGRGVKHAERCPKCGGDSWVPAGHIGGIAERQRKQQEAEQTDTPPDNRATDLAGEAFGGLKVTGCGGT
jgi:hypothetical protein